MSTAAAARRRRADAGRRRPPSPTPAAAPTWQTWRYALHDFAPRLFKLKN